jgi:hypothetical protein
VVDVKYACQTATDIWLAMPHFTAGSLHTLLEQRFLTVREIVKLGLGFVAGGTAVSGVGNWRCGDSRLRGAAVPVRSGHSRAVARETVPFRMRLGGSDCRR